MQTDKQNLAAGQSRLHGIDAVRAFALLLGVVLHATMSFFPGPQVWLVKDSESSIVLSVMFFVIHMLRMLTFFLIAGFVARMSMKRLGAASYFKDRLRRIGVPLVVGWPILFVALMAAAGTLGSGGGVSFARFPLMHLWFLYLLGVFYLALALLHPVLCRTGCFGERVAAILLQPWAIVMLSAPLCAALYLQPYWVMWFGIPTPDTSFIPNLPAVLAYGGAFAFGWLVQQRADVLPMWGRRWAFNLGVALACTLLCLGQAGLSPLLMPVPQGQLKLVYAACYSLGAWAWALALVGMAQRFLNRHSAWLRYLADASYWIYLVHLPLIVALQVMFAPLSWPWFLKFLLILAVAFVAMLATYALLVRRTVVGAVLNGRTKS